MIPKGKRMVRRLKVPSGFYRATEAMQRLGRARSSFYEIGVRPDIPKNRKYGQHLIEGAFSVLESFAERGILIKKAYAHSRTPDGINLCRKIGFKETPPVVEGDTRVRFELELEQSSHPLLRNYQEIARRHKESI